MKRLWCNKINDFGSSLKVVRRNICAICRGSMKGFCMSCMGDHVQSPSFVIIREEHIEHMKWIWYFLLIEKRRDHSLFNILDINAVSKIYSYSVSREFIKIDCHTLLLECGHEYHTHCFEKWARKISACPLCNSKIIKPLATNTDRYDCVINGSLTRVVESMRTFKQIEQDVDDRIEFQPMIANAIKHYKPGYIYSELYDLSCKAFNRVLYKNTFDFALSELVRKEFIKLIDGDVYIYN